MPAPYFDYAALAPEIILTVTIVAVLVADLLFEEREKYRTSTIAGVGCLVAMIPVLYLAGDGADRTMFSGAYLVDNYALVMKALFLLAAYVTILLSANYIEEGDRRAGHDDHGLGPRPDHDLRRPRDAVDSDLPAGRLAQARRQVQRVVAEVLPDGRAVLRGHALRHVDRLRHGR
jgi:hypothetical protein